MEVFRLVIMVIGDLVPVTHSIPIRALKGCTVGVGMGWQHNIRFKIATKAAHKRWKSSAALGCPDQVNRLIEKSQAQMALSTALEPAAY